MYVDTIRIDISLIFLLKKFIALAWTTGKNKVNCTSEGQQLLITVLVKIYKNIFGNQCRGWNEQVHITSKTIPPPQEVMYNIIFQYYSLHIG